MMRRLLAIIVAGALTIGMAAPALAGSSGYEGQPGGQSNGGSNHSQQGYEGQPGNQGN